MSYYFILRWRRLLRLWKVWGIHPLIAILGYVVLFVVCTTVVYIKTPYAPWLLLGLTFIMSTYVVSKEESAWLKVHFSRQEERKIAFISGLSMGMLGLIVTSYSLDIVPILLAVPLGLLGAFVPKPKFFPGVVYSPFSGYPFEYTVGWRQTWFFILLVHILVFIAVSVSNFNLGLFSLVLLGGVQVHYYTELEPMAYIAVHKISAKPFLLKKIKTILRYSTLLHLLTSILLLFFFTSYWQLIVITIVMITMYIILSMLMKYASIPYGTRIPEAIIFVLCLVLPFLLFGVLPYYFQKAKNKLNPILA